jgi:hypothetical protein
MYNKQYFEIGNEYKIIGEYCIHKYNKDDLFNDDNVIATITKHDCNNIVALVYDNGKIERYPVFDSGDRYYIFGSNMLCRIYNASKHDTRANVLFDKIDDYNHDRIEDVYILRYNQNDLLK